MSARVKESPQERETRRRAAYERGWVHSLRAYDARSCQPWDEIYDYARGWHDCSAYRWADPANRGDAPDETYRKEWTS